MSRKQKRTKKNVTHELSPAKKRLFTLIALAIPIVFILLLETGLRIADYGGNTTLFVPTPTADSPYFGINQIVGRRYFYRDEFAPSPRKDLFLKEKPENGYRIFLLGGSSAAGFPYGNNLTFSRILQRRLVDAFPEKRIEVINCAFTAINSYTLLDFMDEILAQKPDLLLMYAGHNEFYGALGVSSMESLGQSRWFVKAYLELQRFKIFVWVRNSIASIRGSIAKDSAANPNDDPTRTVMARIVKDKNIPYKSALYEKGIRQFQGNVKDIIRKARAANVPIVLSEVVSNIHDQQPFVSIKTEKYPPALSEFEAGQRAETAEDYQSALAHYTLAKDLDALRFRASEDINTVIHELASEYELPVVPMKTFFEQTSPNGLIGENVMWEHLHPKSNGYFIMADAFFQTLRTKQLVVDDWSTVKFAPSHYYEQNWGLTKLDSVHAELAIRQLKGSWPFVQDGSPNRFMTQFQPKSREEEIAFNIIAKGEMTLEQGHLLLADEYKNNNQFVKAFQEYKALVYTVPTLPIFYEPMVELLLSIREYNLTLRILHEALKYQDSAFVYKWIGQIYLVTGDANRGIQYLEQALEREPNDDQAVYNITRAYYSMGRLEDADRNLDILRQRISGTQEFEDLVEFRESIVEQQKQKTE